MENWERRQNMKKQPVSAPWRSRDGSSWVNILLGIWVVISPFVLAIESMKAVWNNVATGVVIGILACIRWSNHRPGWSWLTLIVGIWLVISPFVLVVSGVVMLNNVLAGIIIASSALTNTYFKESA
jgi:SPW repeat